MDATCDGFIYPSRNTEFGEFISFVTGSVIRRRYYLILLTANTALRKGPEKEWLEPCILGTPGQSMQGYTGPIEDFFLQHHRLPKPT